MANTKEQIEKLIPGGAPFVSHGPAKGAAEWKAQLETVASGLPPEYTITKTLVFKPSESSSRHFNPHDADADSKLKRVQSPSLENWLS